MNPPSPRILEPILSLIGAAILAYSYKTAGEQAEHLYKIDYHPAPQSDEEKARYVRRKKRHLEIFSGFCFWLLICGAGIYFCLYIRAL